MSRKLKNSVNTVEGVYLPPQLYLNAKLDKNLMWVIQIWLVSAALLGSSGESVFLEFKQGFPPERFWHKLSRRCIQEKSTALKP